MTEDSLTRWIARQASRVPDRGLQRGIGDDCAIFRPSAREELLFTSDFLIEDVHFRRDTHPADAVGHKALARGLSDIAAMGGRPRFCLLSLALAPWTDERWVKRFFAGFLRLARRTHTALAGGDLSHAGGLTCDVTVCGSAPRGKALRRDGARAGDALFVSGKLGRSWLTNLRPNPRLDIGMQLAGRATAAMDLSDGLALDLHRLCDSSQVAAKLEEIPVARGSSLRQALAGGEDYELLFTLPAGLKPPRGSIRIGGIVQGRPGTVQYLGERLEPMGYDHFDELSRARHRPD